MNYEEQIALLLDRWKTIKADLTELYKNRKQKETMAPMIEAIDLFQKFLLFANEKGPEDQSYKVGSNLKWSPINVTERLDFIKNRPNLYHSFIQLSELMHEQEKQYNKKQAIKK